MQHRAESKPDGNLYWTEGALWATGGGTKSAQLSWEYADKPGLKERLTLLGKNKHQTGEERALACSSLGPLMFQKFVLHLASIPLFNPPH